MLICAISGAVGTGIRDQLGAKPLIPASRSVFGGLNASSYRDKHSQRICDTLVEQVATLFTSHSIHIVV
jgi:hypothetical protein